MVTGSIYKITNKLNGKCYIGLTTRDPETRFYEYRYYSNNIEITVAKKQLITQAIAETGYDNFSFEVLETNIPNDLLDVKEKEYITKYDSFNNGYNRTQGGRPAIREVGRKNSKPVFQLDLFTLEIIEMFDSVSEAARVLQVGPTQISNICNKKDGSFTSGGFTFCFAKEYDRVKMEEFINKKKSIKSPQGVEVYYLDKNETIDYYMSYSRAAEVLKLNTGNCLSFISGERKTAGIINDRPVGVRFVNNDEANAAAEMKRNGIIITNKRAQDLKLNENPDIYWNYKKLYDIIMNGKDDENLF